MTNKLFDERDIEAGKIFLNGLALAWSIFLFLPFAFVLFLNFQWAIAILSLWFAGILVLAFFAIGLLKLEKESQKDE